MSETAHWPGFMPTGWDTITFEPFRAGVDIARLYDGPPSVALLRYAPGASVPPHRHAGLETILVLSGAQSDERGTYGTGSLVLNPAGTTHRVWSEDGCVVLIQWTLPVEFLSEETS
jgi:anti-sigma factor ChrR (cupin superfamily)